MVLTAPRWSAFFGTSSSTSQSSYQQAVFAYRTGMIMITAIYTMDTVDGDVSNIKSIY